MNIEKLNDEDLSYDEWDSLQLDCWEVFKPTEDITSKEKDFALEFLSDLGIDIDDEHIIDFRAKPVHFCYMAVHLLRKMKNQKSV